MEYKTQLHFPQVKVQRTHFILMQITSFKRELILEIIMYNRLADMHDKQSKVKS